MRKLLLLICIGILPDIAMAHAFTADSCNVPLTVLSGNVECKLTDFNSDTIECKVVKLSHITSVFKGTPSRNWLKLAMTSVCMEDDKCFQAFDCQRSYGTDDDGCHFNPLVGEYHCH